MTKVNVSEVSPSSGICAGGGNMCIKTLGIMGRNKFLRKTARCQGKESVSNYPSKELTKEAL